MVRVGYVFFILFLGISQFVFSQKVVYLTNGLLINGVHRYGREALYSDTLAWQLNSNTLKKPVAGATLGVNDKGEALVWKEMKADSANVFKTRGFGGGGYLYFDYNSSKAETVLLNIRGNSAVYVNGVLHAGDPYSSGWLYIPVALKKGGNDIYVRTYFQTVVAIVYPAKKIAISTADSTMPHVVLNKQTGVLKGAVVVVNASDKELKNYQIKTAVAGKTVVSGIASVPAMTTRKVIFEFDAANISQTGKHDCSLTLVSNNKVVDEKNITLEAVDSNSKYSTTFVSNIDGSLQYYAVTPQTGGNRSNSAMFLSVHGAGVEAIGQAKAYQSKDWGTLVAATNRRPRGFNWEDWGRLDALEVLHLGKERFHPDPNHIYLTGHSMGGHGTWFLGATYPGNWAGIAPCSGYPTLKEYGSADGKIPDSSKNPAEQMLLRAGNQSDVVKLATNYKPLGVYILHGDSDRVVSVKYARQMKKVLADFHSDYSYYEYPGGEHWFGDQSVDWKPLFEFFKWHQRLPDSAVNEIDFMTSSPGISAAYRWATVIQQTHPLAYSRIKLQRNNKTRTISGTTDNVRVLSLALNEFATNTAINISLDGRSITYNIKGDNDTLYLAKSTGDWAISNKPGANDKGPQRYGTFKESFNNRMIFVYGTSGNKEENEWSLNKARYDAESWYYRGNGAVDIIADKDYSLNKYSGRGVVLYGNSTTNAAWNTLLANSPVQVTRNTITVGDKIWSGDDLAAYFTRPMANDPLTSVSVVGGTGLKGMHAADANQYFAGGSGFPDFMIFRLDMLTAGAKEIKAVGFFDNEWNLSSGEMIVNQ